MKYSFSAYYTKKLGDIIEKECPKDGYEMELNSNDTWLIEYCVNQGIDSHLEACFVPSRGDSFKPSRKGMTCSLSPESLKVLVRRLLEFEGDDEKSDIARDLASSICETLEIELL